jgi:hypothetical protein
VATLTETLTPTQLRAYHEVVELCRRCSPHLDRLRFGGYPQEQDEERLRHLMQCAEAVLEYERTLVGSLGVNNGRNAGGQSGDTASR